ncbi:leucyl/phenylalanyl-tRNA--protein transferase [Aequorivita echinoideorum]|uniref:Leucyl/phenylalanyl-tRNA--protein transferase n=1 Tax=Aequorivita echinoideorum TaxID=1549647 RepID=A0ABS5S118_9FLAO|nr:leucyl/phenylalanyl-tRNA--protein transferase [Aequorivita echinoideorum]MBT0606879.1 leucyl/phenylalanyl-tRNA--protein transferase [Aequorivita echinoideorum]
MFLLDKTLWFPSAEEAFPENEELDYYENEGLLAVGGDLSKERLLLAYNSGIFPWFEDGQEILWWCPDPRMVLFPEKFKVSKSLRKTLKSEKFEITFNKSFSEVIRNCASVPRKNQSGTWITNEMQEAYINLHNCGQAISVEVWENKELVGGLYGIDLPEKKIFCGESMFSVVSDASKVAFYHLAENLFDKNYTLIDCQIYNEHLESLGAEEISRVAFLNFLNEE